MWGHFRAILRENIAKAEAMEKLEKQDEGVIRFVPVKPVGWDYNAKTVTFLMKRGLGDEVFDFFNSRGSSGHKTKKATLALGDPPAVSYDGANTKPENRKMTIRRSFIMKKEWYMKPKPVDALVTTCP